MAKPDIILKLKAVCLTRWRLCRVPGAARLVPRVLHQLLHRRLHHHWQGVASPIKTALPLTLFARSGTSASVHLTNPEE